VPDGPAPAKIDRALVHLPVQGFDGERVFTFQQVTQAAADLVGEGGLDDGLRHEGAGVHLPAAHEARVGVDSDQEGVLRAVAGGGDLWQAEVNGLDLGDFHGDLGREVRSQNTKGAKSAKGAKHILPTS
jgi:hypothetical protein